MHSSAAKFLLLMAALACFSAVTTSLVFALCPEHVSILLGASWFWNLTSIKYFNLDETYLYMVHSPKN
uniref:Uncharacterized protein n=1 Tax=Oryza glumipatula TaxID=40148 RepID=A0A0E0BKB3_9ORYZ